MMSQIKSRQCRRLLVSAFRLPVAPRCGAASDNTNGCVRARVRGQDDCPDVPAFNGEVCVCVVCVGVCFMRV
jgi:hypothetical protein